jgi:beta-glucosidase
MTMFIFPTGFLWGTASSPSQVEDGLHNDWEDEFVRIGAHSPAHIRHFRTDLAMMKRMRVNAYRFGFDWSRLQASPRSPLSKDGIDVYRKMFLGLKEERIAAVVTLHHFANPKWLEGGWRNPAVVDLFLDFVDRVTDEFGDSVSMWNLINEPEVYVLDKYIVGAFPPNLKWRFLSAYSELRNMMATVRSGYSMLRSKGATTISIAKNFRPFHAFSGMPMDRILAGLLNSVYNDWIFDSFFFAAGEPITDLIGINYYGPTRIKGGRPFIPGVFPQSKIIQDGGIFDDIQEIHPPTFKEVLSTVASKTHLPIIILENGIGSDNDQLRSEALAGTLREVASVCKQGIDIRGYFHWSLLDNIEWNFGNTVRFGLVEVSPPRSYGRRLKRSGELYASICARNGIELPT